MGIKVITKLESAIEIDNNGDKITSFIGVVAEGRQLGRKIGFPTANIQEPQQMQNMKKGVYGVSIFYKNRRYYGVMNYGGRPSFKDCKNIALCEVNIFGFNQSIYGQTLKVDVCFFVRDEKTFATVEELIDQIGKDVRYVKDRFH